MILKPKVLNLPKVPLEFKDTHPKLYDHIRTLQKQLVRAYSDIYISMYNIWGELRTLEDNATPPVEGWDRWKTGGTTTITDFDDGFEGQIIYVVSEHAITITDGTNVFLSGSANFDMQATDTLTLIQKADGKWYELGRSDNT